MEMKSYWNNTSEPIIYKEWVTLADNIKANHFVLMKSKNIVPRLVFDAERFTSSNGGTYSFANNAQAEFETTCEEQELVLKLLYGSDLILKRVNVVTPYSVLSV
jgi:hypothetical protein